MGHETGILEDAQMLRHGRPADGKLRCELRNRSGPALQELEDLTPGWIAERVERMSVSVHLP
jgi:hypothetical protein